MKKRIYNWLFKKALKVISHNLVLYETLLTPQYLIDKGWIEEDGYYIESNIKKRDIIYIKFSDNGYYYSVFHSINKTFIAEERSIQWFENYYLLIHPDNGRYELCNI